MKLLLPYETYIKQRLAFHLLFSSDADRRRSTLNLSSHQMALELLLKQREQRSVWPHHYSSVRLDPFAPVNISVEGGALKALKSSSVVVLVKAVCSLCVQFVCAVWVMREKLLFQCFICSIYRFMYGFLSQTFISSFTFLVFYYFCFLYSSNHILILADDDFPYRLMLYFVPDRFTFKKSLFYRGEMINLYIH